jgi:hypothetical protein
MIPTLRPVLLPKRGLLIFCADCELDHIYPRITGPRWSSPDGASRFQCPGLQGRLASYCAGGLVLLARLNGEGVASGVEVEKLTEPFFSRRRHRALLLTTRVFSRALPTILRRRVKPELLAAAANALQLAIEDLVFRVDRGVVSARRRSPQWIS